MLDKILKYQELDAQIKAIEQELANTEERKRVRIYNQFIKETNEKLKSMENDVADLHVKYSTLKEQYVTNSTLLSEYSDAVEHIIDEDELKYLKKKYDDLVRTLYNIEKDLQAVYQDLVSISKVFDECKAKLLSTKKKYDDAKEKFEAIRKQREPEISKIQKAKVLLEKQIPEDVLKKYKELRDQNISKPFVMLESPNRCGGCRMDLSMGQLSSLETKGYIRCESCHRIIYKEQ